MAGDKHCMKIPTRTMHLKVTAAIALVVAASGDVSFHISSKTNHCNHVESTCVLVVLKERVSAHQFQLASEVPGIKPPQPNFSRTIG